MNTQGCSTTDLISEELIEIVLAFSTRLSILDEQTAMQRPSSDGWSIQEVVGHLIDSAVNNHQRFVRAQNCHTLCFPKYDQNYWVAVQDYNACSWHDLIDLWRLYNLHLAHIIRRIPDSKMRVQCTITPNEPVSLSFLIDNYLTHLKHHLNKINERISF